MHRSPEVTSLSHVSLDTFVHLAILSSPSGISVPPTLFPKCFTIFRRPCGSLLTETPPASFGPVNGFHSAIRNKKQNVLFRCSFQIPFFFTQYDASSLFASDGLFFDADFAPPPLQESLLYLAYLDLHFSFSPLDSSPRAEYFPIGLKFF